MRLQSLMVNLTADDLHWILNLPFIVGDDKIQDLSIRIGPQELIVSGKFPTRIMYVPFTTYWVIESEGPNINFKLNKLEPINLLKNILLEHLRNKWCVVEGDTIKFDLKRYLKTNNIPIDYDLCHITLLDQQMSINVRMYVHGE